MKMNFLLISILLLNFSGYSQSSATEAKAAYLLAEESFAANDFKGAISYLEECQKKMGAANSKMLYLQIMAQLELAKTDAAYNEQVLKSIQLFEKAKDIKDFNEDKVLEVTKTKLRLNRIMEAIQKEKNALEDRASYMKSLGGMIVTESNGHGLIMANADIGKMDLKDAKKACEDLVLNNYDDWRLPTLAEFTQMLALHNQLLKLNPPQFMFTILSGQYHVIHPSTPNKKWASADHFVRPVRNF